jgi:hypothetical protein
MGEGEKLDAGLTGREHDLAAGREQGKLVGRVSCNIEYSKNHYIIPDWSCLVGSRKNQGKGQGARVFAGSDFQRHLF